MVPRGRPSPKLAITVHAEVHDQVLAAAKDEGASVSAWMTADSRRALLVRDRLRAVAEWELGHGGLSGADLDAARRQGGDEVGHAPRRRSA